MILTKDPAEFIYHYANYKDKDELRKRIQAHITYKTCRIFLDVSGMVCAVCCWNIDNDCKVAFITEMTIREDCHKQDIMRKILKDGMKIWPVKYLMFDRTKDKDGKAVQIGERKVWSTERFLRRKV